MFFFLSGRLAEISSSYSSAPESKSVLQLIGKTLSLWSSDSVPHIIIDKQIE